MQATRTTTPLILPRGLIFAGSLWLIGSWLLALGVQQPVQPSSASYTPGVRIMMICIALGLMLGWPLLRLSQDSPAAPLRQTLLDLIVLLALVQVVIWPLRLVTPWSPIRVAALDATLSGWSVLAGAIVAAGIASPRAGVRALAMCACVGMCVLGPAAAWMSVVSGRETLGLIDLSPLMAVHTLTATGGSPPSTEQWRWIAVLATAAVASWAGLGLLTALQDRPGGDADPPPLP